MVRKATDRVAGTPHFTRVGPTPPYINSCETGSPPGKDLVFEEKNYLKEP